MIKRNGLFVIGVIVLIAAGAAAWFGLEYAGSGASGGDSGGEPLYWVAPMDPSYRRDGPGKSPMGMDLVPVYEEPKSGQDNPGAVYISPDVVNNFGVRTARVVKGTLHSEINTVGYVQYDQDRLVHLHPRVEGWVERLYVKASGDPVTKGQPLYALYSPQLVNAQEEMLIATKSGNARLVSAARSRLMALRLTDDFIATLQRTGRVQQTVTFRAAQDGVVDNLNIREGFFVQPGTTLMAIGTLDEVWVESEIFERQAARVSEGLPVTMTLDYLPGRRWQGRVDYVYPALDPNNRTLRVRLRFPNPQQVLKPNMFAQVTIHVDSEQRVLQVPREAVIRTAHHDRVVLSLGDGHFKSVVVTTGRSDSDNMEILSGLAEGDKVVTSAQFLIDSESSRTSDFRRLHHAPDAVPEAVWVAATIHQTQPERRQVTLTHEPIAAWGEGTMTMDMTVADNLDMSDFAAGDAVEIEIASHDRHPVISGLRAPGSGEENTVLPSARVTGVVNHLDVDAGQINISRGAIEKWGRPPATMDFTLADPGLVAGITPGQRVDFTFVIVDGRFVVTRLSPVVNEPAPVPMKGVDGEGGQP